MRRARRIVLAPGLVLLSAGCAVAPAPEPPAPPPAAASPAGSLAESRAILLLLADRRAYDATTLELMLGGEPAARRDLAVALGRIGDARGRSLLQGLLVDTDPEVRRDAAFALGELGDAEAKRALITAAVDDDEELGRLAVESLGKLGAPLAEVRRALGAIAPATGWSRLAPALFRFAEPAAVEAAREGLATGDTRVRSASAYALGRLARPEGVADLRALVADPDPFVRAWAARGLGEAGGPEDLARLAPLTADSEPSPAIQALRAGGRILTRAPALPPLEWSSLLRAALAREHPGVRAAALEAAGRFLPNPELESGLREVLAGGEPRERELALAALAAGRVEGAADLVRAAAVAPDRWLRVRAAEAAGPLGELDLLATLAEDAEPPVRVAALESLAAGTAGLPDPDAATAVLAARFLEDPDPTVRATALDLATRAPGIPAANLAAALDAARGDRLDDARLAGVRALAARAKAVGEERAPVVEALTRLGTDRNWLVRREAAAALDGLGEPRPEVGPLDLGRDLVYYRGVVEQTAAPWRVELTTERGVLELELACPQAPLTCLSFLQLGRQGYFDGTRFHRVVPDFVVQGGDPRGDGWGGPGYSLRDEINRLPYAAGALGMALSGPDTGGSQFFLTLSPQPHLDGGYTVFGRLTGGKEVLDRIRQGDRILSVRVADAPGAGRSR